VALIPSISVFSATFFALLKACMKQRRYLDQMRSPSPLTHFDTSTPFTHRSHCAKERCPLLLQSACCHWRTRSCLPASVFCAIARKQSTKSRASSDTPFPNSMLAFPVNWLAGLIAVFLPLVLFFGLVTAGFTGLPFWWVCFLASKDICRNCPSTVCASTSLAAR